MQENAIQNSPRLVGETESVSRVLRSMATNEAVAFPAARYGTVRSQASSLGFQLDRKFTLTLDRPARAVIVTRTA